MVARWPRKLTCAYHKGDEAVGVCTRCGRAVCSKCFTKLRKNTFCKNCYEEIIREKGRPTAKPVAGGVLGIISGITAASLIGPISLHFILKALGYAGLWATSGDYYTNRIWYGEVIKMAWCPLGLITILLSLFALERKNFWAALFGGICATVAMPLLGLPALIFVVASRKEFDPADDGY